VEVPRQQRQRLAVYGLAIDGGRLLLCRASSATEVEGWWWLPGGGVDFGESPPEALIREFVEETGLTVTVGALLGVVSDVRPRQRTAEDIHTVRLIYAISSWTGTLQHETDGTTDLAAWQEIESLGGLKVAPYVLSALDLRDGDLSS
jgi:ADP-ribose pyrophosphatase YjhB (NUDIX family)